MNSLTLIALLVLACGQSVQASQNRASDQYIDALASAPNLPRYSADGAADVSVTSYDMTDPKTAEHHIRAVLDIVNLGQKAIPLLIAHLDDMRPTSATFYSERYKRVVNVPVGYVCLDLLTNIVKDTPRIFIEPCTDDGLGACFKGEFYFWPDAFNLRGRGYMARPEIIRAKSNWQRSYRMGYVKYRYPRWWKLNGRGDR
jgi:hypothetical protein